MRVAWIAALAGAGALALTATRSHAAETRTAATDNTPGKPLADSAANGAVAGADTRVALDLRFFFPTELRLGLYPPLSRRFLTSLEGFFGFSANAAGLLYRAGGATRMHFEIVANREKTHAMVFGPGMGGYVGAWDQRADEGGFDFDPDSTVYGLLLDADLYHLYQPSKHVGLRIGVHAGADLVVSGLDSGGRSVAGRVRPMVSLFCGIRL